MRVLLIEDDPMIGAAVQAALQDASYAADWVQNGLIALAALTTQHYDLVLLDLGLPGKDGLAVLDALRTQGNPVPLLIITARDGMVDRIRGLDAGADDYLLKPFEMAELLARMRAVLRRKGGAATRCWTTARSPSTLPRAYTNEHTQSGLRVQVLFPSQSTTPAAAR